MAEPILDLSTVVERPTILIDESIYDILSPDALSALDHQRFAAWGRRIDALTAKDELTAQEEEDLAAKLAALSDRIMVGVPEDVRAKLSDAQRKAVIEVFSLLPLGRRLKRLAGALPAKPGPSTGERSSPGSSASTAAGPNGGSRRRPSGSSVPIS